MPTLKQSYKLDTVIQKNDLTISYQGIDLKTEELVFIKGINLGVGSFTDAFKKEFLTKSFKLSQKIKSNLVLTPLKLIKTKSDLLVIYPFLSSEIWEPLNEEIFKTNIKLILKQICFILDHIHECELVHCDIKLSNFFYNKITNKIILIDLDFITENHSKCNAIVKGTTDYISPDVIKNDIITKSVDYYALATTLESIYVETKISKELKEFKEEIKEDIIQKSISSLLELLKKNKLIDFSSSKTYKHSLFALFILQVKYNLSKYNKRSKKVHFLKKLFSVENKIVGFDEEILDLIIDQSQTRKKDAFNQLRSLILNSKLEKIGEYWICKLPEDRLISIVSRKYRNIDFEEQMIEIKKLKKDFKFYTVYLIIKFITSQDKISDSLKNKFLIRTFAESCIALNKPEEALATYEKLLSLESPEKHTHILYEIASLHLTLNQDERALIIINENLKNPLLEYQLRFKTLQHLIEIRKGNYTKAEDSLNYIIEQSQEFKINFTEVIGYYYLSLVYYYKGENSKAVFYVKKGIDKAKEYKLNNQLSSLKTMLVLYYSRTENYQEAISLCDLALREIDTFQNFGKVTTILNHLFISLLRIGNYSKSSEVLLKSLSTNNIQLNENKIIIFFLHRGLLDLYEGKIQKAKSSFLIVTTFENKDLKNNIGSAYQNLVQLSLYTNNQEEFQLYYEKAKSYFDYYKDSSSKSQIEFFKLLNEQYNLDKIVDSSSILQIYINLKKRNESYYSTMALFQYLLISIINKNEPEYNKIHCSKIKKSKNPFMKCVIILLKLNNNKPNNQTIIINLLKCVYKEMSNNNFLFFAAIVASLIAELYKDVKNHKLSIKFYEQASELFGSIDNSINLMKISEKKDKLLNIIREEKNSDSSLVKELSYILKNIENYEESLSRSLQFILDQTGAERAVILLKKENSSELRIKSYINCDEDCLTDIYEFSSSISLQSFQQQSSIVIENALEDSRSKQLQSIIAHNIKSIIAIPIKKGNKILGVLYLDHQTIPALFTQDDIDFANLLANLLSIILHTLDSFRNISIINQELVAELESKTSSTKFISNNKNVNEIFEKLPNIAKTNATILLLGESGTGKEVFADIIHKLSLRANKPFIKVNCTAFAENLIESELFGIDKNVATDVKGREGKFSVADTGTIFIDEIGDMPLNIQSKILRAIEYQQFEKVGSNRTIRTDIRFIYATNKDLSQLVKEGKFREDLYHRINTIPINIPSLRNRKDDIPLLIDHFIKLYKINNIPPVLSPEILSFFDHYNWPGNVRELKNMIERLCIIHQGEIVQISHLPSDLISSIKHTKIDSIKEITEKHHIIEVLKLHKNIESRAAKSINMSLSTFRRKLIKYNIRKSN